MTYNISFIKRDTLYSLCKDIITTVNKTTSTKEDTLYKNIIDPFSAVFEASYNKISLQQWIKTEQTRQIQKTLQNEIGTFHQKILGSVELWQDLKTGNVVDLINEKQKIIAEIKNKFNTTKGNHKVAIYDDFDSVIKNKYKNYTAYYVAILSKKKINQPFTPSDNKTKTRRPMNESIREIDGSSFYEMVTGDKDGLYKIYQTIPSILSEILNQDTSLITKDPLFEELFKKAFR